MNKLVWYKRYPDDALTGMQELTLEERGAYNTVLDLIYSRAGEVPDDDRFLSGWMACDARVWRRVKAELVRKGKIRIVDGRVTNGRAEAELARQSEASEQAQASAEKRWGKKDRGVLSRNVRPTFPKSSGNVTDSKPASAPGLFNENKETGNAVAMRTHMLTETETETDIYTPDFDAWWSAYPRKTDKKAAFKAFKVAIKTAPLARLIGGVERYAKERAGQDPKYTKHGASWLNGECWKNGETAPAPDPAKTPEIKLKGRPATLLELEIAEHEPALLTWLKGGFYGFNLGHPPNHERTHCPKPLLEKYAEEIKNRDANTAARRAKDALT